MAVAPPAGAVAGTPPSVVPARREITVRDLLTHTSGISYGTGPAGFSTDVLGVVVERASGMSLDEFFRRRILGPLGMADTHFFLPPEKRSRLAAVYSATEGGPIQRAPDAGTGQGAYVEGPRQCFWADPQKRLVAVLLAQLLPNGGLDLQSKFRSLVYQSIVGPPLP